MTPKLFKATDVCQMAQLQPYVLRSWEKEFPGIGVQTTADSPRLYRQSDVDQVLRIKQLIIVDGLTVAGARRKIEESQPATAAVRAAEVAEVLDTLGTRAKTKIANVRDGLKALQAMLAKDPGELVLESPRSNGKTKKAVAAPARVAAQAKATKSSPRVAAKVATKKSATAKRRRANA